MNQQKDYEPRFSGFHDLMNFRVREILLVSSQYDAFVIEEDGRLSEKIFSEYLDLNLQFVPRITRVSSAEDAFAAFKKRNYDLVITMTRIRDMKPIEFGRRIKEIYPEVFVVLLTYETIPVQALRRIRKERSIDKVFHWSGDNKLLLAIIKFAEDLGNVKADTRQGVQVIMLVDDNPSYYSVILPFLYTEIMKQTRYLISHAVNDLHRLLRMRARPKILLADSYEDAVAIFQEYKPNLLGVISDMAFPRDDSLDARAGFHLLEMLKSEIADLPVLIQSRESLDELALKRMGISFIDKNSPHLIGEIRNFVLSQFGFGDFVFRTPDGNEIGRAANLSQFEEMIKIIPDECLHYHASRNHFSIWLRARTEFELADEIRPKKVSDFRDCGEMREFILSCIEKLFRRIQSGVITDFGLSKIDSRNSFIKLGSGSLGGKGRGIAYVNAVLFQSGIQERYPDVDILIPHTFILCSEGFEEFLEMNRLSDFALNERDDQMIAERFLQAPLPGKILHDLEKLVGRVTYPLAVRSSSILEDSQVLPFAGLYSTYMIPNNHPDAAMRLQQLTDAVRLVYASVFYRAPKEYVRNAMRRIEDEKMAVLIQQVVGEARGDLFYPVISGIAQSYNFYPFSHMHGDDGVVGLALGLGKIIMEKERVFRYCPAYPEINPPFSSPEEFLAESQSHFDALNLGNPQLRVTRDESCGYRRSDLSRADADGTLAFVASTYSPEDNVIHHSLLVPGPRVLTFAPILKFEAFPMNDIIRDFLDFGKQAFASHVVIEFAVNLFQSQQHKPGFYFLQIRPMVVGKESQELFMPELPVANRERELCRCTHALGNGIFRDIFDLVYINPKRFDSGQTRRIASEIEAINQEMAKVERSYILICFGRIGTSDPWLGIPLEWHQMSRAQIVIESNLGEFRVDPSQGSHFFHNMISLNIGYFHITAPSQDEFLDWDYLEKQPAIWNGEYSRHIRFDRPIVVQIDARSAQGVIFKPGGGSYPDSRLT